MKKPLHERIAATEERKALLVARLAALKGKAKAVDRKRDTRRKIVIGAAVLTEMEREPKFAAYVRKMLGKAVTRAQDRDVLADLLTSAATEVTASPASGKPVSADATPEMTAAATRAAAAVQVTGHDQHPG